MMLRTCLRLLAPALLLPAVAAAAPSITAGQIVTPSIDVTAPPPAPKMLLHIKGTADSVMFVWTGPSGQNLDSWFVGGSWTGATTFQATNAAAPASGFGLAFNLYTQAGAWALTGLNVCAQGACTYYSGNPLASLFGSVALQIANPNTADITPPTAMSATISTPAISLSKNPTVSVLLKGSDDESGLYSIAVEASMPGNVSSLYASNGTLAAPPLAGTFKLSSNLQPSTPTGTYTVSQVFLEDYAGNSTVINDASAISKLFHGHVTIDVTN